MALEQWLVGPTRPYIATSLVMHAQSSDYEASRTKCGSCCKGPEIRYYWYTSNSRCANSLRKLSPLIKKIYRVNNHCHDLLFFNKHYYQNKKSEMNKKSCSKR